MSRAATIILVSVALALVVFVSIYVPLRSHNGRGKTVGSALFDFNSDDIRGIKIKNGDKSFELKRGDFGWKLASGLSDRASSEVINKLIQSARSTIIIDRISANEIRDRDELSEYGLKKSAVQIDFKGDGDPSLLIGKDSADDTRVYVRFEDSRDIYLIPNTLIRLLLQSPEEFRDRQLTNLEPARVERVVIRRASGEVELKHEAQGWRIIKPLDAPANDAAISSLITRLHQIRISSFFSDKKNDPAQLGLSEPLAEIKLYGEGERNPQIIRLASPTNGNPLFAQLLPRDVFCELPSSILNLLPKDLTSFRDLSIAHINLDFIDMIRFSSTQGNFVLRRSEDGWKLEDGTRKERANLAMIEHMVDLFAKTKSIRFNPSTLKALEENGLKSPSLTINFLSVVSENTPESLAGEQNVLEIKLATKKADGTVPVHVTGSSEIMFVPANILDTIPQDSSAWLQP